LSNKGRKAGLTIAAVSFCIIALVLVLPRLCAAAENPGEGKWPGVDETVVEKIAREHHREAMPPLIDVGRGDLLLPALSGVSSDRTGPFEP